jgi:hypothetical protein
MWCSLCLCVCVWEDVGPTANGPRDTQDSVWLHAQNQCRHSITLAQNKHSASVLAHGMQQCGPVLVFPVLACPSFTAYLFMTCGAKPWPMSVTQAAPWMTHNNLWISAPSLWETELMPSGPIWMDSPPHMRYWICIVILYIYWLLTQSTALFYTCECLLSQTCSWTSYTATATP